MEENFGKNIKGDTVYNIGELSKSGTRQIEVKPYTLFKHPDPYEFHNGRMIAVNETALCYVIKEKNIRVIGFNAKENELLKGHAAPIVDISFFPAGDLLCSLDSNGDFMVWEIAQPDDQLLKKKLVSVKNNSDSTSQQIKWHPLNQNIIAILNENSVYIAQLSEIIDLHVGRIEESEPLREKYQELRRDKENNVDELSELEQEIKQLEIVNWDEINFYKILEVDSRINDIAFNSDGNNLVIGCENGSVCIWDYQSDNMHNIKAHDKPVYSVIFCDFETNMLITGANFNSEIRLWDLDQFVLKQTLTLVPAKPTVSRHGFHLAFDVNQEFLYAAHTNEDVFSVFHFNPDSNEFDFISEFNIVFKRKTKLKPTSSKSIRSFVLETVNEDYDGDKEDIVQLFCLHETVLQMYRISPDDCLKGYEYAESETASTEIDDENEEIDNEAQVDEEENNHEISNGAKENNIRNTDEGSEGASSPDEAHSSEDADTKSDADQEENTHHSEKEIEVEVPITTNLPVPEENIKSDPKPKFQKKEKKPSDEITVISDPPVTNAGNNVNIEQSEYLQRIDRLLQQKTDKLLNEILRTRKTSDEIILSDIKDYIEAKLPGVIENVIHSEIQRTIVPELKNSITNDFKVQMASMLEKKLIPRIESINASFNQEEIIPLIGESFKMYFQSTLIPAFNQSCNNLFSQLHNTWVRGMQQFETTINSNVEYAQLVQALVKTTQQMNETFLAAQTKMMTDHEKMLQKFLDLASEQSFRIQDSASEGSSIAGNTIKDEILDLISNGEFEDTFSKVLRQNDLELLSWTISQIDLEEFEDSEMVSQYLMISIIQQLTFSSFDSDPETKLAWLDLLVDELDVTDSFVQVS
eukprot:TRINITY_DN6160_c0_g1_i1.p1 TRINITY_DN6160_c0_g1~~TRINITY_DN6160_c0_g1_i1.p1  ORF type:complete len:866 (-),score=221.69 TRINITY_DN6160_c0_g1_i1:376-2973(-)